MARQTTGNRVDTEAHLDATITQLLGDFSHRILGLRHRHTVARGDDDGAGVLQQVSHFLGAGFAVFAHLLISRGGHAVGAEATGDHGDEGAVHRLAHDVREDRTGGTHQGTGDDQQVVGEHEARRRRRPTGVRVQHGDYHRHVCATDGGNQMPAEGEGDQGHHQQGEGRAARVDEVDHQRQRSDHGQQVQLVAVRQHQWLGGDQTAQFAEGNHGTGKGYGTDEDAQEDLDQMDVQHGAGQVLDLGNAVGLLERRTGGCQRGIQVGTDGDDDLSRCRRVQIDEAVEAHQHRCHTHEAVQHGHQLGHLGHLDLECQTHADGTADHHGQDDPVNATGLRVEYGGEQGDSHTRDTEQVAMLGRFLLRQSRETEDEEHGGNDIGCCYQSLRHVKPP